MNDGRWEIWQLSGGCLVYLHSRLGSLPGETLKPAADAPPLTMPFGKYRGAILDIVLSDLAYTQWLLRQPWFCERHPIHREYLLEKTQPAAELPDRARPNRIAKTSQTISEKNGCS
jgi:hypothetical protein